VRSQWAGSEASPSDYLLHIFLIEDWILAGHEVAAFDEHA